MTILQELARLYDHRAEEAGWPRPGFSTENVGAVVVLAKDGSVREIRSLMTPDAKGKRQPRRMSVPTISRTSGIKPAHFWDKTAYALGITNVEGKDADGKKVLTPGQGKRTQKEHEAFRELHLELLSDAHDPALIALRRFCETWQPEGFTAFPDAASLVDQNMVFRLGGGPFIHTLPAALALLETEARGDSMCLVSGRRGPVARLHPMIKGVMGAQSSGAPLVSFEMTSSRSHGKLQGDNAPVSDTAAFAYGVALNSLLARNSGNSLRIGGDTVAFWADEAEAEDSFRAALFADADGEGERELRERLIAVAEGRARPDSSLDPATRLFVLGLAPNAARLAVRYWYPGTLGDFAKAVTRFWKECAITPSPFTKGGIELPPKPWALLYDVAAQGKADNIPNGLGGDLMRSILTGQRYPQTWLAAIIGRLRVEGEPDHTRQGNLDGRRAAMIRAVLMRNYLQEVPMALNETADNAAYLLGRLFGAYVYAERSYQKRGASLRQKYLGAASATPARIFPVLMRGYEHNLASLRKGGGQKAGAGVRADKAVASIVALLPGGGDLPATLPLEEQGRFFIGFYHQISAFYAKAEDAAEDLIETNTEDDA